MNNIVIKKCPLCSSDAKSLWPQLHLCKCQSCGLLFRYPAPSLDELSSLYETSWGDPNNQLDETGATSSDLAQEYGMRLAKSLGRAHFEGLRILDYGAGRGEMLKALRNLGAEIYAIEPFGYEFLRDGAFKVFRSLSELPENLKFDGIISLDVIEHMPEPWDSYGDMQKYLVEGGWLYVSTPNAGGINAQYYRARWREFHNRGHLFFFTRKTLELALEKSRYKNIQKLQWFINYHRSVLTSLLHWLLQFLHQDGELRYLVFR
jgi:2-polyprenyl-3-methyl-5-hydroxy-6-metoxy-1,4-benzoquinol methylase